MTAEDDRWTWSPDEIRRVGYRVVDLIAERSPFLDRAATVTARGARKCMWSP